MLRKIKFYKTAIIIILIIIIIIIIKCAQQSKGVGMYIGGAGGIFEVKRWTLTFHNCTCGSECYCPIK